jgi:N-acetyl-beta-hexosaminidase
VALSRRDAEAVAAASVPVIASPLGRCSLDVPYADPAADGDADAAQADRHGRLGLRVYAPKTIAESFRWEPAERSGPGRAAQVAGVEAAIWAETISGFDDLSFLLLPRLPGVAHRAWSLPAASGWAGHRDRLARHGRLWAQDGLTYFRAAPWTGPSRPGPRSSSSSKNPPICRSRSTRWTSRIQWQAWPFRSVRRIGLSLPGAM